jgi:hypothetical protein
MLTTHFIVSQFYFITSSHNFTELTKFILAHYKPVTCVLGKNRRNIDIFTSNYTQALNLIFSHTRRVAKLLPLQIMQDRARLSFFYFFFVTRSPLTNRMEKKPFENLTVSHLVNKIRACSDTINLITTFTAAQNIS